MVIEVVESAETHGFACLSGGAAEMRQKEGIGERAVIRVDFRLSLEHIEASGRDAAG